LQLTIRLLSEADGRWIADIPDLPGVTVYGATPEEATLKAKALALRVKAEEIRHGNYRPDPTRCDFRLPHERLACDEGAAGACGATTDRVAYRPQVRFPSYVAP